ncbi:hypothetical protein Kpol_1060p9 [Vanderwaltozyma polyspora DSM 70294]|uniref:tRNA-dihydrouridine(20) synthase [NAD(P)+] n=1 Tax=Vanderwaltozyma polyspora (strain ATCC 22028 / DSM 70294 / BCRC 21397 / CBS 2163 / NBRC 10782 / NRRL Y-8283 / UCD 57-17) TaxID=436907 RepID=A7TK09_VANPO|nr:uncharacterized protein Kpol_1060p9 [Vanderwaltozyma polyspora DSM 70294]EDO17355.1 hypothetical protein Kpol_1060p9 [Vanderwaltozyma polyspora DSM 70294]
MVLYAGKLVLAPMVRAGELPTRLLALQHGADLLWTPEIIDKKLIQCTREENKNLDTVDFIIPSKTDNKPSTLVFRTFPKNEQGKLIFQMGTSSPTLAVEAALKIVNDVDGIDINAGCPKHFSIHSGMGAALLKTPDILCSILENLVSKVGKPYNKPISVKIRILDDKETTVALVERLCTTGISNLTVHCRTTPMRNREAPIRDYIPSIKEICEKNNVSLIMNGAIKNKVHFKELREELGLSKDIGGMIAECAETNPTVFSQNPLMWYDVCKQYIKIANEFENIIGNTKYMLNRIIPGKSEFYQYISKCKNMEEINHVIDQIGPDGTVINDPTEYLAKRREEEKLTKKRENDMKSQMNNGKKKHFLKNTSAEPKAKKFKAEVSS